MPYFDRFDICEAHYVLEMDWNDGGIVIERPSNRRRNESSGVQLHRLGFNPRPSLHSFHSLTQNGQRIYLKLCERYGFPFDPKES